MTRLLTRREGISSGISAGAAIHAALTVMKRPEMVGKIVVTILPGTGDRYASSGLFDHIAHDERKKLVWR